MTTPSWPSGLVSKLLSVVGYSEGAIDPTIESNMDSGPPKRRPRFTAIPKLFTGQIDTLSSADVDTFYSFYDNDCVFGSLPFTWVHPRTGVSGTFQFRGKRPEATTSNGSGIVFAIPLTFLQLP